MKSTSRKSEVAHADIKNSETGIEVTNAIGENFGDEVRPKNMIVQWIIRVI